MLTPRLLCSPPRIHPAPNIGLSLFKLPAEIRNRIYEFAIPTTVWPEVLPQSAGIQYSTPLSLMCSSLEVFQETYKFIAATVTVRFECITAFSRFLKRSRWAHVRPFIRHLSLKCSARDFGILMGHGEIIANFDDDAMRHFDLTGRAFRSGARGMTIDSITLHVPPYHEFVSGWSMYSGIHLITNRYEPERCIYDYHEYIPFSKKVFPVVVRDMTEDLDKVEGDWVAVGGRQCIERYRTTKGIIVTRPHVLRD
ncbi:hypothetical protein LTR17_015587 [Elasticomyces elasticus]|nr:hypothetical protein LTR17_015587 [Elasticomyces elasticus]